jgi:hypothetical protein
MPDFFSSRIQADIPKRMVPTSTWTVRECPVCHKWARKLVRPRFDEPLQSEICVDFCDGDKKYPNASLSFKGSWVQDGHSIIETLKGDQGDQGPVGPSGAPGRDGLTPTREELVLLVKEVLRSLGFWRLLFGSRKRSLE